MRRANATTIYYLLSGSTTLAGAIMFTTLPVYYVQQVGMNPLQLVLVGTALEATILLVRSADGRGCRHV